ncbi:hypothetical protein AOQ84DRAFT_355238 [Glonium stellatum]|uniref:Transmembrane protein n=1 Tax=Glonium stellatum TaxID=574774 RepID=A0A8E2EYC4_9PEZI|nr:hypothetical protein AOQ84DRAFT_355238 [Glonium stellatum]
MAILPPFDGSQPQQLPTLSAAAIETPRIANTTILFNPIQASTLNGSSIQSLIFNILTVLFAASSVVVACLHFSRSKHSQQVNENRQDHEMFHLDSELVKGKHSD